MQVVTAQFFSQLEFVQFPHSGNGLFWQPIQKFKVAKGHR